MNLRLRPLLPPLAAMLPFAYVAKSAMGGDEGGRGGSPTVAKTSLHFRRPHHCVALLARLNSAFICIAQSGFIFLAISSLSLPADVIFIVVIIVIEKIFSSIILR